MFRFWFILQIFGVCYIFDVTGQSSGEYYIIEPQKDLALQKVGLNLELTQTPSIWILKEYRSGNFIIEDASSGDVFTKINKGVNATVGILPRSKNRKDKNQRWIVTPSGTIRTPCKPRLYLKFGESGPLFLSTRPNLLNEKFEFKQLKSYGIFAEDMEALEISTTSKKARITSTTPKAKRTTEESNKDSSMVTSTTKKVRKPKPTKTTPRSTATKPTPKPTTTQFKTKYTTKRLKTKPTTMDSIEDYTLSTTKRLNSKKPKVSTTSKPKSKSTTTRSKTMPQTTSGEYKILQPNTKLGLEKVGSRLKLTSKPSVWILKQYRTGDYVIEDASTGEVFTKTCTKSTPVLTVLPRSKNPIDIRQRWIITTEGRILTIYNPTFTVKTAESGHVFLSKIPNSRNQQFQFQLVNSYGGFGEDLDSLEKFTPKPTTHPGTTSGEYKILQPITGLGLENNVKSGLKLTSTPTLWIMKEYRTGEYVIQDASTGEVLTKTYNGSVPILTTRPRSDNPSDRAQRWIITPQGRILTTDTPTLTVEFTKFGSAYLSNIPKSRNQVFLFKQEKNYGIFGEDIDEQEESAKNKPRTEKPKRKQTTTAELTTTQFRTKYTTKRPKTKPTSTISKVTSIESDVKTTTKRFRPKYTTKRSKTTKSKPTSIEEPKPKPRTTTSRTKSTTKRPKAEFTTTLIEEHTNSDEQQTTTTNQTSTTTKRFRTKRTTKRPKTKPRPTTSRPRQTMTPLPKTATGEYKILHPKGRLGLEKVGSKLQLSSTPTVWILKEYRTGDFIIEDASTGKVLTKIDKAPVASTRKVLRSYEKLVPILTTRPRSENPTDRNQRWIVTAEGRILTADTPTLTVEYTESGSVFLSEIRKSRNQKFQFKLKKSYGFFGDDMDSQESIPKPSTDPETTSGEYKIFQPQTNVGLEKVKSRLKLTVTPSLWILKEYRTGDYVIQDALTGKVLTKIDNDFVPILKIRPRSDNPSDRNQRWIITPEGRILTSDTPTWTVEFTESGSVFLSDIPNSRNQEFYFKLEKEYRIFGEDMDKQEEFIVKPTTKKPKRKPVTKFPSSKSTTTTTTRPRTRNTTKKPKTKSTSKPNSDEDSAEFTTTENPKATTTKRSKTKYTAKRPKPKPDPDSDKNSAELKPTTKRPKTKPDSVDSDDDSGELKITTNKPKSTTKRSKTKCTTKRPKPKPESDSIDSDEDSAEFKPTTKKPKPTTKRPNTKPEFNCMDSSEDSFDSKATDSKSDSNESHSCNLS